MFGKDEDRLRQSDELGSQSLHRSRKSRLKENFADDTGSRVRSKSTQRIRPKDPESKNTPEPGRRGLVKSSSFRGIKRDDDDDASARLSLGKEKKGPGLVKASSLRGLDDDDDDASARLSLTKEKKKPGVLKKSNSARSLDKSPLDPSTENGKSNTEDDDINQYKDEFQRKIREKLHKDTNNDHADLKKTPSWREVRAVREETVLRKGQSSSLRNLRSNSPAMDSRASLNGKANSCRDLRSNLDPFATKGSPNAADDGESSEDDTVSDDVQLIRAKNKAYREEVRRLRKEKKELKQEKDAEIAILREEITELRREIRNTELANRKLKMSLDDGANSLYKLKQIEEANLEIKAELKETVEKASTMLKEREATIDKLADELEQIKNEYAQARNMFDVTLYKNKVKLEEVDREKDAYAHEVARLEQMIKNKR